MECDQCGLWEDNYVFCSQECIIQYFIHNLIESNTYHFKLTYNFDTIQSETQRKIKEKNIGIELFKSKTDAEMRINVLKKGTSLYPQYKICKLEFRYYNFELFEFHLKIQSKKIEYSQSEK